jgi:hypothetical protein
MDVMMEVKFDCHQYFHYTVYRTSRVGASRVGTLDCEHYSFYLGLIFLGVHFTPRKASGAMKLVHEVKA